MTVTPTPTMGPTSTPTPDPTPTATPKPKKKKKTGSRPTEVPSYFENAKISHYTPWTGGTNCSRFVDGVCVSRMASGEPWQDWVDKACACPKEFPFGTKFIVEGRTWVCMDRGGAIRRNADGTIWLDLLTDVPPVSFGMVLEVGVIPPD